MKPEDKAAFNDALVNRCQTVVTVPQDFEAGWQAALAHRDAQPAVAVNEQLLEALKELMYARTDKAEGMADAAIAAAQKELDK